mmetsp:Transcript_11206/g.69215  ORF Transcript_11206/g.69215 Transcript_11206/m.69215 type:complete len:206 (-) Transcript_11206:2-619(-)
MHLIVKVHKLACPSPQVCHGCCLETRAFPRRERSGAPFFFVWHEPHFASQHFRRLHEQFISVARFTKCTCGNSLDVRHVLGLKLGTKVSERIQGGFETFGYDPIRSIRLRNDVFSYSSSYPRPLCFASARGSASNGLVSVRDHTFRHCSACFHPRTYRSSFVHDHQPRGAGSKLHCSTHDPSLLRLASDAFPRARCRAAHLVHHA